MEKLISMLDERHTCTEGCIIHVTVKTVKCVTTIE